MPYQDEAFRRINPLGKIPALVLDDGSVLIDSPVICEYLNHAGGGKFFPGMNLFRHSSGRWKALGLAALGDGIAEAAVGWVVEGRQDVPNERARARHMAPSWPGWMRWSAANSPRTPPSARFRWLAPWAMSISACPSLIGDRKSTRLNSSHITIS